MPTIGKPERTSKRGLVSTHVFDAPRELVWKAWTNPKLIPRWWAEEIHHGRGEDGRPTWRDLAIRPAGRRGERVRFPRGIPGSRAFRTNRRNLRIRGDAGTCPRRERGVR